MVDLRCRPSVGVDLLLKKKKTIAILRENGNLVNLMLLSSW